MKLITEQSEMDIIMKEITINLKLLMMDTLLLILQILLHRHQVVRLGKLRYMALIRVN